jgi:hypothetical protein
MKRLLSLPGGCFAPLAISIPGLIAQSIELLPHKDDKRNPLSTGQAQQMVFMDRPGQIHLRIPINTTRQTMSTV